MKKNFDTVYSIGMGRSAKAGVPKQNEIMNESVVSGVSFQELARQGLTALSRQMEGIGVSFADVDGFFFPSAISQKLLGSGYYALPQMLLRDAFPELSKNGKLHAVGRSCEKACSSGGDGLRRAWEMILAGDAECAVVFAAEKMCGVSNNFILGGLTDWRKQLLMANLAEIEALELQKKFGAGFSAKDHDDWGLRSYALAKEHAGEHIVVPIYHPEDGTVLLDHDNVIEQYENRLYFVSDEKRRRRMCFPGCNIMTVLNSSQYATAYSWTILASENFVEERNIAPLARIITIEEWSEDSPEKFIIAPYGAMQKGFHISGLSLVDLEWIELNEAFALAALYFKAMCVSEEILNPHGGAIADGHPIAATFLSLFVKAWEGMKQNGQRIGAVATCNAAEEAEILLFERL